MTLDEWKKKVKGNSKYIKDDTIVIEFNKTSEEIYNANAGKKHQDDSGVFDGSDYLSVFNRRKGQKSLKDKLPVFLHCPDGIYLAISGKDSTKIHSSSSNRSDIKALK